LESHVEPVDENSMNVIMPDGWTFIFLRNGNTETWRGNAGWVGETNNTVFTITAPCGWRIKFDGGKIQQIDSNKNRTLSFKYNGPAATEVDVDGKPVVQVESDSSTGVAKDLIIGGQKVDIALAPRPRIQAVLNQNLVTGFDQSLSQLQWPDAKKESFAFGTDNSLTPTLAITHTDETQRNFSWDPTTRQIKTDGDWTYTFEPAFQNSSCLGIRRTDAEGQFEYFANDPSRGKTVEKTLSGNLTTIYIFVNAGVLNGEVRKKEVQVNGATQTVYEADYDEAGRMTRLKEGNSVVIFVKGFNRVSQVYTAGKLTWSAKYDNLGHFIEGQFLNNTTEDN